MLLPRPHVQQRQTNQNQTRRATPSTPCCFLVSPTVSPKVSTVWCSWPCAAVVATPSAGFKRCDNRRTLPSKKQFPPRLASSVPSCTTRRNEPRGQTRFQLNPRRPASQNRRWSMLYDDSALATGSWIVHRHHIIRAPPGTDAPGAREAKMRSPGCRGRPAHKRRHPGIR